MTKSEIIVKAQLYLDDMSELSSQEFSDLFDKMYRKVNSDRPWQGTKKEFSGSTVAGTDYVALPSDFLFLTANGNYTDASYEARRPVVFRGQNYSLFEVVNWDDRRQYRNHDGYAYIDIAGGKLFFTKTPTVTEMVEFDYHAQKAALALNESPWFPAEYHDVLYHLMVADNYVILQSDKAKSYQTINEKMAKEYMDNMAWWNSQLVQM